MPRPRPGPRSPGSQPPGPAATRVADSAPAAAPETWPPRRTRRRARPAEQAGPYRKPPRPPRAEPGSGAVAPESARVSTPERYHAGQHGDHRGHGQRHLGHVSGEAVQRREQRPAKPGAHHDGDADRLPAGGVHSACGARRLGHHSIRRSSRLRTPEASTPFSRSAIRPWPTSTASGSTSCQGTSTNARS